jgi:surfeit locus 1 family protein
VKRWRNLAFVVLMLGLTALFAGLGLWQVERLGEKEALIATVGAGLNSAPVPLSEASDYRPVAVSGQYIPDSTVFVFTGLGDAKGQFSGPGYWVMTPLALDGGGSIFVNRGFIPQDKRAEFAAAEPPTGTQTLVGLARSPESSGSFTPVADVANRIDWVRDPERLAALIDDLPQPVSAFTIDLPAGAPGELPQGGETVIEFPNNHLGYAITWFGFAVLTPILLLFWLLRQRQGRAAGA